MEIVFKKSAQKYIESLDRPTKQRIRTGLDGLLKKPPEGNIKALQGGLEGEFRLRIGGYRVIYRINGDIITVKKVDSRGGVYK